MKFWVTAEKYIEYYTKLRGINVEDMGVGEVVVVSWNPSVVQRMAERAGARPSEHWPMQARYPLFTGELHDVRVSFAQVTIGAPHTVAKMEQMIACGARVFLGLGWAGSLTPRAPIGSVIVPTTAIREEGTSFHYLGKDAVASADPHLVSILEQAAQAEGMPVNVGPHWTTDSIYRESEEKIAAYREMGVLGVDMETSAMYAIGQVRNIPVANLLVVSDTLWGEWSMAFSTDKLRAATIRGEQVMLRALETIVVQLKERSFG